MFSIIFPIIFGIGTLILLGYRKIDFLFIVLSFIVGFVCLGFILTLLTSLYLPINKTNVLLISTLAIIINLVLLFLHRKQITVDTEIFKKSREKTKIHWVLWGIVGLGIVCSFFINFFWPVDAWDSIALYDTLAKFYAYGYTRLDLVKYAGGDLEKLSYYYSYPPSSSAVYSLNYLFGRSDGPLVMSFFYMSILVLFYSHVSKVCSALNAVFWCAILSTSIIFVHSTIFYANLPCATFMFSAYILYQSYRLSKIYSYLYLSLVMCFGVIMIRPFEPFVLILIVLIILDSFRNGRVVVISVFALGVIIFFRSYLNNLYFIDMPHIKNMILSQKITKGSYYDIEVLKLLNFDFFVNMITYLAKSLQSYFNYFAIALILSINNKDIAIRNRFTIIYIALCILALMAGTLFLANVYEGWNRIPDSVYRMMIFTVPIFISYFAMFELKNEK